MKVLYQCETCATIFDSEAEARGCEALVVPAPRFERGHRFGPWEIRSLRVRRTGAEHQWTYEARARVPEANVYRYQEFAEREVLALEQAATPRSGA